MELLLDKGRGYVPADEPRANELPFGYIAVDSIYTPIKNVKYSVENTRVEQRTDYERLLIDIQTDGSIHPEDALKGRSQYSDSTLHAVLGSDNDVSRSRKAEEDNQVDEEMLRMRKLLKTSSVGAGSFRTCI
jgi:DNA-directed RNA polymerase subunit alpha